MLFGDLLRNADIDPKTVLVMRHRPTDRELRKALPWVAAEHPDVYNAYQQTQSPKVESSMKKAGYIASFIGHKAARALFIGLYVRRDWRPITYDEYWSIPAHSELRALGNTGEWDRETILWFDLDPIDFYPEWKGRLVVDWPPPERSWYRWAARNRFHVHAIHEQSVLDAEMPTWDTLTLTWEELRVLPAKWKTALGEWRGVYFIYDVTDGKGYVGSAYGGDNIFGRWQNYAASGHGGNKELRRRDHRNFRFSILQRTSPDMEAADVIRLEATWKDRLHTREGGLNKN